ncbi:MAG: aminotransferase class IV [Salinivirgaceae bacterium]|nr:aminotransferase class IV [Salinivirgaceae bacterium]
MKLEFIDSYYFTDNELRKVESELPTPENIISVYEIIRIIGGIPLFIEDHVERLFNSLQNIDFETSIYSLQNFKTKIASICEANQKFFGNIEIRVSKNETNKVLCYLGFIPHKYPEPLSYLEGVLVDVIAAERERPTIKIKPSKTRLKANEYLNTHNCFEVLLMNNQQNITEGSRSNFFYFYKNQLFTAPDKVILQGVTRKYIVKSIENLGIELKIKSLANQNIKNIDAAFLTGTSLGLLPIKSIGNYNLNPQYEQLKDLKKEYNNLVQNYLSSYKTV